ncbi:hypothetical protein AB9F29_21205, partial [Falsihalocynthiibacter sp. S25ZX9]|uniref:hypothetical protein n=1 Tax=Falsihalocynthiibacter sp. S25ZX9 TaxID=3240870 RepID=UPI00350F6FDA
KSQHAVQLNNKSYDDISWQTLHLFLKIKVLRRPVEATALSRLSLRLDQRRVWNHGLIDSFATFSQNQNNHNKVSTGHLN